MAARYSTNIPQVMGTCALKAELEPSRPQLRLVEPVSGSSKGHLKPLELRGLVAAAFLGLVLALIFFVPSYIDSIRAHEALSTVDTRVEAVDAGQSLWSIAEEAHIPGCKTQDVVDWLKAKNGLDGSGIVAGQRLTVPVARSL